MGPLVHAICDSMQLLLNMHICKGIGLLGRLKFRWEITKDGTEG